MKLDDLLKHKSLILPKNWKKLDYSSYYECVVNEGANFLKLIENLDKSESYGEDKHIGDLSREQLVLITRKFFSAVVKTLQCYLNKGNPHKAYNVLNDHLTQENRKENYKPLLFYLEFNSLFPRHYRIRAKEGKANLSDLFHVPFELRHRLNSYRYSIPGYPTLYLSNSIYLAYKELGNPTYDDLYVSKFNHSKHFNNSETLLDMSNKPIRDEFVSNYKFLARWILTMACSIEVGFPNSPFKAEYIMPQIILLWVKNNFSIGSRKIIGVSYSSTKIIDSREGFYGYFYNTAIPIRNSNKDGYCDVLSKQFCLTKPISFNKGIEHAKEITIQGQVKSVELNGASVEYIKSDFGKIEQTLSEIPFSELYYINGTKY